MIQILRAKPSPGALSCWVILVLGAPQRPPRIPLPLMQAMIIVYIQKYKVFGNIMCIYMYINKYLKVDPYDQSISYGMVKSRDGSL